MDERIDRGATDDALARQLRIRHRQVFQADADDEMEGHLVERPRIVVGPAHRAHAPRLEALGF